MNETIEHNNRFYGEELKTESEQLKEWLKLANEQTSMYKSSFEEMSKNYFESQKEIERLNNIINEINSIVEYWGYDKEHNDISSFRMAMKSIKDILGSDKE